MLPAYFAISGICQFLLVCRTNRKLLPKGCARIAMVSHIMEISTFTYHPRAISPLRLCKIFVFHCPFLPLLWEHYINFWNSIFYDKNSYTLLEPVSSNERMSHALMHILCRILLQPLETTSYQTPYISKNIIEYSFCVICLLEFSCYVPLD